MAPIPLNKPNIIELIEMSIGKTPEEVLKHEKIKLILSSTAYEDLYKMQKLDFIDQYKELKILVFEINQHSRINPYLSIAPKFEFERLTNTTLKEPYKITPQYDPYGEEWRKQMEALPMKTVLDLFHAVAHDKMDMQKQIILLEAKVKEREDSALDMGAKTIAITRNYADIMRRMNEELMKAGYSTANSREMADLIQMIDSLGPPPKITVSNQRPTTTGIKDKYGFEIKDRHIVKTDQDTIFVVDYSDKHGWVIIQSNKGSAPEHQGESFPLKEELSPNLEIIGDIDKNPELLK